MSFTRTLVVVAVVASAGCSPPAELPSADRAGVTATSTLSGQVVVEGTTRGDALIYLYDATNPPPPIGTGHPVAFQQIPPGTVFGAAEHDDTSPGPFTASYTFPLVAPGTYLVAASLDSDTCLLAPSDTCQLADFNPFYDVTDEPNGGDLLGGHVDAAGNLTPVVMPASLTAGVGVDVTGVAVVIGGSAVPSRPAFQVLVPGDAGEALDVTQPATLFALQVRPVNEPPVNEQAPVFLVRYQDENGDGVPDVDANGIPQLWPKVFVRKVAEVNAGTPPALTGAVAAGLRDENDLNNTGQLDPTGIAYSPTATPPTATANSSTPSLILLEAALAADPITNPMEIAVPAQLYAQLAFTDGGPDVAAVVPQTTLPMVLIPQALDASNPASPVPLQGIPAGRYAVIVEQYTGQTWRLPNELQPAVSAQLGVTGLADQGWTFTVAP